MSAAEFTPREREVASRIITGATTKQVAQNLGISPSTVKKHLASVYVKAGVCNRVGIAIAIWSGRVKL